MDHLPYPEKTIHTPIEIPFLITTTVERYHDGNFANFPIEAGWHSWLESEPLVAAARAQSWLFFGLLREIFGSKFDEQHFLAPRSNLLDGFTVVTRTGLPSLLQRWSRSSTSLYFGYFGRFFIFAFLSLITFPFSMIFSDRMYRRLVAAPPKPRSKMKAAMIKAEEAVSQLEDAYPQSEDVQLVCLSVRALLWSLRNAAANASFTMLMRSSMELSNSPYLKKLLLERGMCPHHLDNLEKRSSVATMNYLAGLQRPTTEHESCTTKSCSANIIDVSTYETKHVERDCSCEFVGPNPTEVRSLIDQGEIPLVAGWIENGKVRLDVRQAGFDTRYTAISHVWSGGLGNVRALQLPSCQLRRIFDLLGPSVSSRKSNKGWSGRTHTSLTAGEIKDLDDNPSWEGCLFWMDTLCLPKERAQCDIALNQMTRIYAAAQQVVVLDPDLRRLEPSTDQEEVLVNLISSSWLKRAWTFQEGKLGQRLLTDVGGSLQDPFLVYYKAAWETSLFEFYLKPWSDELQFRREIGSALFVLRPLKDDAIRSREFRNFVEVWNELTSRTTSWTEDKLKILTLMLDLSVSEIQSISDASQRGGEAGFIFDVNRANAWFFKASTRHANRPLDLRISDIQDRHARVTLPQRHEASVAGSSDDGHNLVDESSLYLIFKPEREVQPRHTFTGRGCQFKIVKEEPTFLVVAYDGSFSYTFLRLEEGAEEETCSNLNAIQTTLLDPKIHVKLACDWQQWPALQYQRSTAVRLMTTTQGPTHPYAVLLWFWHLVLGMVAMAMIVIVFPNAPQFSEDFWFDASPAEWTIWGCCIVGVIVRIHVGMQFECRALNRRLKAIEYQKWTESFDGPALNTQSHSRQWLPLSSLYQYHSWWVIIGLVVAGAALLAIGLTVDQPNLYDISLVGGYLLVEVISRASMELFYRTSSGPRTQAFKTWLANLYLDDFAQGFPNVKLFIPTSLFPLGFQPRLKESSFMTHGRGNLGYCYEDPVYLPEDYLRMR